MITGDYWWLLVITGDYWWLLVIFLSDGEKTGDLHFRLGTHPFFSYGEPQIWRWPDPETSTEFGSGIVDMYPLVMTNIAIENGYL